MQRPDDAWMETPEESALCAARGLVCAVVLALACIGSLWAGLALIVWWLK